MICVLFCIASSNMLTLQKSDIIASFVIRIEREKTFECNMQISFLYFFPYLLSQNSRTKAILKQINISTVVKLKLFNSNFDSNPAQTSYNESVSFGFRNFTIRYIIQTIYTLHIYYDDWIAGFFVSFLFCIHDLNIFKLVLISAISLLRL